MNSFENFLVDLVFRNNNFICKMNYLQKCTYTYVLIDNTIFIRESWGLVEPAVLGGSDLISIRLGLLQSCSPATNFFIDKYARGPDSGHTGGH